MDETKKPSIFDDGQPAGKSIREQLDDANAELTRLRGHRCTAGDLEEFKKRVVEVLDEYDVEELSSILDSLGLEVPSKKVTFSLESRHEFRFDLDASFLDPTARPADWISWIEYRLSNIDSDLYSHVDSSLFDSDWDDVDSTVGSWGIVDVEFTVVADDCDDDCADDCEDRRPELRFTLAASLTGVAMYVGGDRLNDVHDHLAMSVVGGDAPFDVDTQDLEDYEVTDGSWDVTDADWV